MLAAFELFFDKQWYILGDEVEQFENEYASFNSVKHALGVSNGLDALHLALRAVNIERGDEVIVPSNTYIATLLAVSYTGAIPVLVEPDTETYNIKGAAIESAITPKTRAIMPVHLYGQACEMDDIMAVANKYSLEIIEDNAQAQGASFNGKLTGSFGSINGTSFYPGKNLGALGDAGAVTTDNDELADKVRMLRNYGSAKKYHHELLGFNMRLDECQATFLRIKLRYLAEWTKLRQQLAALYKKYLADLDTIILPKTAENATHVYHLYVIRTKQRDELQEYLKQQGIGTLIHYPIPPHMQKAYFDLGLSKGALPVAEELSATCLSLPMFPGLNEEQVLYIANSIKRFFKK